ncbi:PhoD-like phosphatase-domain-containing protein [Myxozyma melibiosi]|uniref:PhoD-like phosphatase-domain-containing protein n=1 Tax=Myxozyma melibiosi TaxID=54550 RepID=A0ABR1FAV8_9ASCO
MKHSETLCATSSALLRLAGYIFLRWIPSSAIPNILYALFAVYITSFVISFNSQVTDDPVHKSKHVKYPSAAGIILGGAPNIDRPYLTLLTVFINLSILLFSVDLVYTSFKVIPAMALTLTRIGYVSSTSAAFVVRDPFSEQVLLRYKQIPLTTANVSQEFVFEEDAWSGWSQVTVSESRLTEDVDYTTSIVLSELAPQTRYVYSAPGLNSSFVTAASETTPAGSFSFLASSCIKARVPYSPFDNPLTIHGYRIHAFLLPTVDFFLFLGDFTYADVPKLMGTTTEAYRRHYRQVYADLKRLLWNSLPTIHVFDDHEIINDYDPLSVDLYEPAIEDAWKLYQAAGNPAPVRENTTYYAFERQGVPFFLLDTRTYRSVKADVDDAQKTMLGAQQLQDFHAWLVANAAAPVKFVVSSIPFTKNWNAGVDTKDTWAGYLHERAKVLEWIKNEGGGGVLFLSGDRHEAAAIRFPFLESGEKHANDVYEFSTSPFSQFYVPIRTHYQVDDEDVTIMYLPSGNSKVGKVEVEYDEAGEVKVVYRLFIDGKERWVWNMLRGSNSYETEWTPGPV